MLKMNGQTHCIVGYSFRLKVLFCAFHIWINVVSFTLTENLHTAHSIYTAKILQSILWAHDHNAKNPRILTAYCSQVKKKCLTFVSARSVLATSGLYCCFRGIMNQESVIGWRWRRTIWMKEQWRMLLTLWCLELSMAKAQMVCNISPIQMVLNNNWTSEMLV